MSKIETGKTETGKTETGKTESAQNVRVLRDDELDAVSGGFTAMEETKAEAQVFQTLANARLAA